MVESKMLVFFDESGKRKDKPTLMGGFLIPHAIYNNKAFQDYNEKLRSNELKLHWNKYSGNAYDRERIVRLFSIVMNYSNLFRFNVINYHLPTEVRPTSSIQMIPKMVYSKLPERILYGLLRNFGHENYLNVDVIVEKASEYEKTELSKSIVEQLNIQSLYRGERFWIKKCELVSKGQEIGLELTDLILGVIRTIIQNKNSLMSKSVEAKNLLAVELLSNDSFYNFLSNIQYYEWTATKELREIDFGHFIMLFLSQHQVNFESLPATR
ncbi:DUF3800 domain-containing protein [Heliorestis acidaminivorans]|uniref:DUF3800 domain-containing protein n=1 Tax=Heliorestis acidaminivorans TaxID=553427 RepID=A0A6I0ESV6_9FIRM|nr:DUF3800 domain-containing protein [Heliorestis acidaminivorans]KAB2953685.1 DUF3800 domain-containing protein [Heliorestis acidaminivorans]